MARRLLSHKQSRRVQRRHGEYAAQAMDSSTQAEQTIATVVSRFGKQVDLQDENEPGTILRCHQRANIDSLVAGDRVVWQREASGGVVLARLERRGVLHRPDASGKPRAVAANLDRIVVVVAAQPQPHANLLDRYLVAAADAGIDAMIVLNKIDLARRETEAVGRLLAPYRDIGYEVLGVSARTGQGMQELKTRLAARASAIVGQSGVGKSSLVAALLPHEEIRVGELSESVSKGRHTTSASRLYRLESGGALIDSPGIREFGLGHIEAEALAAGFREFRPFLGQCRFRDCCHTDEPGCAIREAAGRGEISEARLASYLQILAEMLG